jgi:hypothetical protein
VVNVCSVQRGAPTKTARCMLAGAVSHVMTWCIGQVSLARTHTNASFLAPPPPPRTHGLAVRVNDWWANIAHCLPHICTRQGALGGTCAGAGPWGTEEPQQMAGTRSEG